MSQNSPRGGPGATARRAKGLRASSFAAVVMLLTEFGLGIWVNLYARLPASDHGKGVLAAFADSVASGPVALALHAILGSLLLLAAITVVARAALARETASVVAGAAALAAIVTAWLSGARFVGDASSGTSFGMAVATTIAILGYVTILFLPAQARNAQASHHSGRANVGLPGLPAQADRTRPGDGR